MSDPRFFQDGFDKRLSHLIGECGEVLAAAGKLQQWGPDSVNPLLPPEQQETNIAWLRRELEDLKTVIARLEETFDKPEAVFPRVLDTDQPTRIYFTLGDGVMTDFEILHRIGHLNYVVELYDKHTEELIIFPSGFDKGKDLVSFWIQPAPAPDSILMCINY